MLTLSLLSQSPFSFDLLNKHWSKHRSTLISCASYFKASVSNSKRPASASRALSLTPQLRGAPTATGFCSRATTNIHGGPPLLLNDTYGSNGFLPSGIVSHPPSDTHRHGSSDHHHHQTCRQHCHRKRPRSPSYLRPCLLLERAVRTPGPHSNTWTQEYKSH